MFKELFSYGVDRSAKAAVGFYIMHLLLIILISALAAGVVGTATGRPDDFEAGVSIGNLMAVAASLIIGGLITQAKGKWQSPQFVMLSIAGGLLALFGGGLLGLLPAAYLSTQPGNSKVAGTKTLKE